MKKKKRNNDSAAVNSKLIRKPIERCFLIFLAPTLAAFTIGFVYPFLKGFYLSFCSFKTTSDATFIGLGNYVKALGDPSFTHAFWYTALYAIVSLLLINIIAFVIAYVLTQGIKGANIFRTVFFMPNLIGGIVLGYIWSMIFNGNEIWILGLDHSDVLAADWLYDDHLYCWITGYSTGYDGSSKN